MRPSSCWPKPDPRLSRSRISKNSCRFWGSLRTYIESEVSTKHSPLPALEPTKLPFGPTLAAVANERPRAEQLLFEAQGQFRRAGLPGRAEVVDHDLARLRLR